MVETLPYVVSILVAELYAAARQQYVAEYERIQRIFSVCVGGDKELWRKQLFNSLIEPTETAIRHSEKKVLLLLNNDLDRSVENIVKDYVGRLCG
jgi:inorganic pyrophosphatase/exopolyphosphatase